MNRRRFLAAGSYGMAMAAAALPARGAVPSRVIDAHVHFYDPVRPQGVPWPSKNDALLYRPTYPDRYLAAVAPLQVNGVIAVEASPWLEDNLWLLEVADRFPLVVGVVGNIRPGHPDFKEALARFAKHPLFCGIRINAGSINEFLNQPNALADLKALAAANLSLDVLLDGPRNFESVARLAGGLPALRVIIGHLPLDYPNEDAARARSKETLRSLTQFPSLYAKVSGVVRRAAGEVRTDGAFYQPALNELWEIFGADRVIYASNWPVCEHTAPYPTVFRIVQDYLAGKDQQAVDKFFCRNALAAYKRSA